MNGMYNRKMGILLEMRRKIKAFLMVSLYNVTLGKGSVGYWSASLRFEI